MKSLHICNLANTAYGYCKILDEAGCSVDLRCHDIKHLMSQPEWDDLELDPADFPDENNFYDNTADFGSYQRPAWYQNADLLRLDTTLIKFLRKIIPARTRQRLMPLYCTLLGYKSSILETGNNTKTRDSSHASLRTDLLENCASLARESGQYGPEWTLSQRCLRAFRPHAYWLDSHIQNHDVVFAYVLSPIYAMVHGQIPYVSVEIGTMRDIPFDGTDVGKMLALAYRKSNAVIITNPDNRQQAERLGISNYLFCPHPLDEDVYVPAEHVTPLRKEIQNTYGAEIVIFAPARQNWEIKGNDKFIKAFAQILKHNINAVLLIPGWGQEVNRTKKLCADLQIDNRVSWLRPLSERTLVKYYQAADFVLDQFQLGVFGQTTPKAMSCGKAVLTSYVKDLHDWCFSEHPPLVACSSEKEIFDAMHNMCVSSSARAQTGEAGRAWVIQHHSKSVVRNILTGAMKQAMADFEDKKCSNNSI